MNETKWSVKKIMCVLFATNQLNYIFRKCNSISVLFHGFSYSQADLQMSEKTERNNKNLSTDISVYDNMY